MSVKINGDSLEGKRLRDIYHYPGYPTIILFDTAGNEIDRLIGFEPEKSQEYIRTLVDYTEGRGTLADYLNRLQVEPNNSDFNYQVAKKYYDRTAYKVALPYIQKVIELQQTGEKAAEMRYLWANAEAQLQQDLKPLIAYTQTSRDSIWLKQAYLDITRYYRRQRQVDKVLATYEAALRHFNKDAQLMNSYAWYIFQNEVKSAYQRGIEVARRAVQLAPEEDGIWDTLGQLLFAAGRVEEAIEAMTQASLLNPDESSYKENLNRYKAALTTR